MSADLNIIQTVVIPYTLIPSSQEDGEVIKLVKSFIENLTISTFWNEQSLKCDFTGILENIVEIKNPILGAVALRFIKPQTIPLVPKLLEFAQFSSIRKRDIEMSLKQSIDLNAIKRNPLFQAYKENREDLALMLIDKGIDITSENNFFIRYASQYKFVEVARVLLKKEGVDPALNEAFFNACTHGELEIVKLFLDDKRVDPAAFGNEPLIAACSNGHLEVVMLLLEQKGVDLTEGNYLPLKWARKEGREEVVNFLLEKIGFDPFAGGCPILS